MRQRVLDQAKREATTASHIAVTPARNAWRARRSMRWSSACSIGAVASHGTAPRQMKAGERERGDKDVARVPSGGLVDAPIAEKHDADGKHRR